MDTLTKVIGSVITFINNVAVPLVFAVAFIVFLFGVFRYYIAGGANPEKRAQGTQLIMYSIIGFAVMIVVWGLVNIVVGTLGFTDKTRPPLPAFGNTSNTSGTNPTPTTQTSPTPNPTTQNPSTNPNPNTPTPGQTSPLIGPRP